MRWSAAISKRFQARLLKIGRAPTSGLSGKGRLDQPDDITDNRPRYTATGRDCGLWAAVFAANASLSRFGEGQAVNSKKRKILDGLKRGSEIGLAALIAHAL